MGRMEAIWGKDCREYKPERWLRDDRFMSESAYKFSAFNGGPRLCLGKDFAYYQMKFTAASILYRYHVTVVKDHPVAPRMALTMYLQNEWLKHYQTRPISTHLVTQSSTTLYPSPNSPSLESNPTSSSPQHKASTTSSSTPIP